MKFIFTIVFVVLVQHGNIVESEKILALSIWSSKSIRYFFEPLLVALADRGHEITVVSPYKTSKPHSRIRDIIGNAVFEGAENAFSKMNLFHNRAKKIKTSALSRNVQNLIASHFSEYYEMPEVKSLLNETFDLVISSYAMNDCVFGFIHHLKAPFILVHANVPFSFNNAGGIPNPTSFVSMPFFGFTDKMNFFERTQNYLLISYTLLLNHFYTQPLMEGAYRKYFGSDTPGINEIAKNFSIMFANSHFSLNYPRPSLPDLIEVSGLHCKPAKPVEPSELNKFLTESGEDGFIYFSLGSVLKGSTMPEEMRKVFITVFGKLKQRVLWKWETEAMNDLPPNVKLSKWVPQQDVLGHPNIKLFITHAGLHSIEEAAYHGVPFIGIPIFADQDSNMAKYSKPNFGFALTVEIVGLTENTLHEAINKILTNPSYKENAKIISKRYTDRPLKPVDEAVYWTEYVLRHKGASHLRSSARDLDFFQYHSIDVVIFLFLSAVTILICAFKILSLLWANALSCINSLRKIEKIKKKTK